MLVESGKIYVRNLRALSRERDALALRQRLDAALSSMDLHPAGVPASAIVCVRSLRTRQPHGVARDGGGAGRGWQESVATTLAGLAARAARPARGPVPDAAEAVMFADRAELLACLAVDWLKGALTAERWWWRSLLSARAGTRALVLGEWLEAPEHVPAALEHLAREGQAVAFARSLGEDEAAGLLSRVAHAHGALELRAAAAPNAPSDAPMGDARAAFSFAGAEGAAGEGRAEADGTGPAPWLAHAAEAGAEGLGPAQQSLLGVGLSLARAPHRARSLAFAAEVRKWRAATERGPEHAPEAADDYRQRALHAPPAEEAADGLETPAPHRAQEHAPDEGPHGAPDFSDAPAARDEAVEQTGPEGSRQTAGEFERRQHEAGEACGAEARRPELIPEGDAVESREGRAEARRDFGEEGAREAPPPRLLEARVETRLGGLFYLVNVGLFLELYGDFTTPRRPGLALPLWDFVALVGRELYGPEICEDPAWPLLARLAGREPEEAPGRNFEPPAEWRVPASWLAPFGGEGFRHWTFEDGRVRLRHGRGFVALDVPTHPEQEPGGSVALETWVGWVAGYVKARLRLALGVGEGRGLGRLVCEQDARVAVTASHVDVHFRLAALPIEVRLAGLDRDPGWVPAAGRYVAFYYE